MFVLILQQDLLYGKKFVPHFQRDKWLFNLFIHFLCRNLIRLSFTTRKIFQVNKLRKKIQLYNIVCNVRKICFNGFEHCKQNDCKNKIVTCKLSQGSFAYKLVGHCYLKQSIRRGSWNFLAVLRRLASYFTRFLRANRRALCKRRYRCQGLRYRQPRTASLSHKTSTFTKLPQKKSKFPWVSAS